MRGRRVRVMLGVAAVLLPAAAPALDFTLGVGPVFNCQTPGPALRAAVLTLLEPTPLLKIREYGSRQYEPEPGDNMGVGVGYADLTVPAGRFCLGAFYRTDYVGQSSRDTLDALVANRAGRPFDVGRTYALDMDSMWLESAGLKVSRVFEFKPQPEWSVRLGVTASVMKALSIRKEELHGSATATSADYAVGTASLIRALSDYKRKDFNPFVGKADPEGYGYAADVGIVVQSPSGWVTEITIMDAYSRLDWQDVPQSIENANSKTIRYDANLNREAFIQGVDHRVNMTQPLEPRYRVSQSVPLQRGFTLVVSDDYAYETHFPSLGFRHQWKGMATQLSYDTQVQAVSLDWRWDWLMVSITSDDLGFGDASVLGLGLQFVSRW